MERIQNQTKKWTVPLKSNIIGGGLNILLKFHMFLRFMSSNPLVFCDYTGCLLIIDAARIHIELN